MAVQRLAKAAPELMGLARDLAIIDARLKHYQRFFPVEASTTV